MWTALSVSHRARTLATILCTVAAGACSGGASSPHDAASIDASALGADASVEDASATDASLADAAVPDADPPDAMPQLTALRVSPPESVLELNLNTAASIEFTVTGIYDDASEKDVTSAVTFAVTNAEVGTLSGSALNVFGFAERFVASTLVTATLDGIDGAAQVTVAAYNQAGPNADALVVLPFEDSAGPKSVALTFSTVATAMDVFFNVDTTGSMDGEVTNLQSGLTSAVIPTIRGVIADTNFGVGAYEDFPVSPYGETSCTYGALGGPDQPFQLFHEVTANEVAVQAAVNQLAFAGNAIGCGNDGPESAIEAMYQIATGEGLSSPGATSVAANSTGIGGVGFRSGTLPVIVNITDALSHDTDPSSCGAGVVYSDASGIPTVAHGGVATMNAVRAICGHVIQISSTPMANCSAVSDGIAWNVATGAVVTPAAWDVGARPAGCAADQCCTGLGQVGVAAQSGTCPLTYVISGNGTGVGVAVSSAVEMLARFAAIGVSTATTGGTQDEGGSALPDGSTTADFVSSVTPTSYGTSPLAGTVPTLTATEFEGVIPGTDVTVTVETQNDVVAQGVTARLFVATVQALADGCRALGAHPVYIVVPPAPLAQP